MNIPINNEQIRIRVKADPTYTTGSTSGVTTNAVSLGGEPIYKQKVGNTLQFKGLEAGANITLTPSATGITISSTGGGSSGVTYVEFYAYTGATETRLDGIESDITYISGVTDTKLPTSRFNTYTGATATALNNKVDKSAFNTYTGATATELSNINSELDLAVTGGTSGTGIAVSKVGRNLVVTYTGATGGAADGVVSGATLGGTVLSLKRTLSLPDVTVQLSGLTASYLPVSRFNTYTGNTQSILNGLDADITYISGVTDSKLPTSRFNTYTGNTETRISGIENDITYISGVTDSKLPTSRFNTYTGATATELSNINSELDLAVTGGTSLGGEAIYSDKTGRNLRFKGLVAGSNITLTPSSTGITIASSGGGGGGAYLPLSGGTVTGRINQYSTDAIGLVLSGSTSKSFEIRGAAGGLKDIVFSSGAAARWIIRSDASTESGSNVGSDFNIFRRADDGGAINAGLTIIRSTGVVAIPNGINVYGDIVTLTGSTTLTAAHAGRTIECNGTFTVTLPNSMVTGMKVTIVNIGTGVITIAASGTLQTRSSYTKLANQYGGCSAYHRGSNIWIAMGDLSF